VLVHDSDKWSSHTITHNLGMGTLEIGHTHACMNECTKLAHHLLCLCHQVERDAYKAECDALKRSHKAECDALKRKCEELRQDLESVMLHACKGPFSKGPFSKGPSMPDDVDDIGHEDKKAKSDSELKQVEDVIIVFKQHFKQNAITNSFAGQEEHHGDMLPKAPPDSLSTTMTMLLPDPVPDQEHLSDELEPLDLGQLDHQLDLGDMSLWSIPNGLVTRIKAASDADTAQ
jgi:hypothetical protein